MRGRRGARQRRGQGRCRTRRAVPISIGVIAIGWCSCVTRRMASPLLISAGAAAPAAAHPRRGGNGTAGKALLLTPGQSMVEFVSLTPDRVCHLQREHGRRQGRHRASSSVQGASCRRAAGRADARSGHRMVASRHRERAHGCLLRVDGAEAALPYVRLLDSVSSEGTTGAATRALVAHQEPKDFPTAQLVTPERVTFKAPDGTRARELFMPPAGVSASAGASASATAHRARASPRWCSPTAVRRGRCCLAGTTASTTRTGTR